MMDIVELAENANTYTPLGPQDERIVTDRYVLWMGRGDAPGWNVAQRFRLTAGELEAAREEIHAHLRAKGRTGCTWEVGTHATPPDLVDRLLALGLVDDEPTPLAVGMVLTEPPAQAPPGVEVRRVETDDEYLAADRIAAIAFGSPMPTEPPQERDPDNPVYLAYVDGEPVARGSAAFGEHAVSLFGGSTLPEARGRGAYRALVAARWEDAAARGTPVLVTQASPMSRPILARLGFREVCEIRILLDDFGAESAA
jgi:GNAT superfamily N-acetyltransferase